MTVSYTNQPTVFPYDTNENRNDGKSIAIDRCFRKPLLNWQHDALQLPPNMVEVSMVTLVCPMTHCWCIGCEVIRKNRNCLRLDAYPTVCCCWTCWMVHAVKHYLAVSWHCDSPSMTDSHHTLIRDW